MAECAQPTPPRARPGEKRENMARWSVVEVVPHDEAGPFEQITSPLVDADGTPLEDDERPVGVDEIRRGLRVQDLNEAYVQVRPRARLGDLLWYRVRGNVVMSKKALAAFDAAGVIIDQSIYRCPLHLVCDDDASPLDYVLLWATRRWNVLDLTSADVEFFRGTEVIRRVRRWALDNGSMPGVDLFATEHYEWLASERVQEVVRARGLCGYRFKAIESQRRSGHPAQQGRSAGFNPPPPDLAARPGG